MVGSLLGFRFQILEEGLEVGVLLEFAEGFLEAEADGGL